MGTKLLKQGNEKLFSAIKCANMQEIAFAQAIIESGQQKVCNASTKLEETRKEQLQLQKRKQELFDDCAKKKFKI